MKVDNYNNKTAFSQTSANISNGGKDLNSLATGDTFKAQILDVKPNQVTMRLSDGSTITARSMVTPDARIGEETNFKVKSNADGQIMVEFVRDEMSKNVLDIAGKANIPNTKGSVELIEQLMSKNIPIDTNILKEAVLALSNIDGLDVSKLMFFLEEEIQINQDNANHLNLLLENKANIVDDLNDLLLLIDKMDNKSAMLSLLSEDNDSSIQFIKALLNNIDGIKKELSLNTNMDNIKNILSKFISDDILNNIDDSKLRELLSHQLDGMPKKMISEIKKGLTLRADDLDGDKINSFYQKIYDKVLDCKDLNKDEDIAKVLSKIQKDIEFMNQVHKFKEFVQLPLQLNNQQAQPDLYVLKNKANQKISKDNASFLLALDLASLGHVEAFIQKKFKNIQCQFKAENTHIINLIQSSSKQLTALLAEKGFKLEYLSCKKLDEPFNVTSEIEKSNSTKNKRFTFDMRV